MRLDYFWFCSKKSFRLRFKCDISWRIRPKAASKKEQAYGSRTDLCLHTVPPPVLFVLLRDNRGFRNPGQHCIHARASCKRSREGAREGGIAHSSYSTDFLRRRDLPLLSSFLRLGTRHVFFQQAVFTHTFTSTFYIIL